MAAEFMLFAQIAGAAYSGYAQYQAAKAQARVMEYNALVYEQNAAIAKQQAQYEAERQAAGMRRLAGKQRVAYLASGVQASGGTALDLMMDTTQQGELDRLAILYAGDIEAVNYKSQAAGARLEAKATKVAGKYRAYATVISGASDAGSTYKINNAGGTG